MGFTETIIRLLISILFNCCSVAYFMKDLKLIPYMFTNIKLSSSTRPHKRCHHILGYKTI